MELAKSPASPGRPRTFNIDCFCDWLAAPPEVAGLLNGSFG